MQFLLAKIIFHTRIKQIIYILCVALITARKPRNCDEALLEDLQLWPDIEAERGELLRGERVPVPQRAAQVVLLVIIMAPGRQIHWVIVKWKMYCIVDFKRRFFKSRTTKM